ncbi:hypothetical protein CF326_g5482 [Tilletia indica]|nr:hypothetical protein CF326_g5482 [Tilletia indica]
MTSLDPIVLFSSSPPRAIFLSLSPFSSPPPAQLGQHTQDLPAPPLPHLPVAPVASPTTSSPEAVVAPRHGYRTFNQRIQSSTPDPAAAVAVPATSSPEDVTPRGRGYRSVIQLLRSSPEPAEPAEPNELVTPPRPASGHHFSSPLAYRSRNAQPRSSQQFILDSLIPSSPPPPVPRASSPDWADGLDHNLPRVRPFRINPAAVLSEAEEDNEPSSDETSELSSAPTYGQQCGWESDRSSEDNSLHSSDCSFERDDRSSISSGTESEDESEGDSTPRGQRRHASSDDHPDAREDLIAAFRRPRDLWLPANERQQHKGESSKQQHKGESSKHAHRNRDNESNRASSSKSPMKGKSPIKGKGKAKVKSSKHARRNRDNESNRASSSKSIIKGKAKHNSKSVRESKSTFKGKGRSKSSSPDIESSSSLHKSNGGCKDPVSERVDEDDEDSDDDIPLAEPWRRPRTPPRTPPAGRGANRVS